MKYYAKLWKEKIGCFQADSFSLTIKTLCLALLLYGMSSGVETVYAATGGDPFAVSKTKALEVFSKIKDIILILGGIGIMAMALMAFFGRFRWAWMFSLVAGLVMVLVAGEFIQYFSGQAVLLGGSVTQ